MTETTTIEIAMEDYKELQSIKEKIEKILRKPISLKKTLSIVLKVKDLRSAIEELMLE
jgi:tRNA(Ser,Leu) C12 N-acetylase TAN1